MTKLSNYETSYDNIIKYVDNIIETLILTQQKIDTLDECHNNEENEKLFYKKQWNTELCAILIKRLNTYIIFTSNFYNYCVSENKHIYMNDISEVKHTIETLLCLIMNIHSNEFYLSSIKTFIIERQKIHKQYQFIIEHINEILPDAPTKKPQTKRDFEILMDMDLNNNKKNKITFNIDDEMKKKGYLV